MLAAPPPAGFLEGLHLVGEHPQPPRTPGVAGQAGLAAEMVQEEFRPLQLLPDLGQEGGLLAVRSPEDDPVRAWPSRRTRSSASAVMSVAAVR